ncbi:MAG: hypothetical protein LBQ52_09355 [Helicobacteraceae bacterium]|jgi:Na+-translocating ferredoxin:NAD+ oxidoreductase RnfE subunit|nr:hypothetical protein [Helicobacteraceae bacterium]
MTFREFLHRAALFKVSLILLVALIAGVFLILSLIVSAFNGEWFRVFKIVGLILFVGLVAAWAIVVGRARTKNAIKRS